MNSPHLSSLTYTTPYTVSQIWQATLHCAISFILSFSLELKLWYAWILDSTFITDFLEFFFGCCCCSAAKSCLTLWDPTNCRMPPSPGVCSNSCPQVSDAISSRHPLLLLPSIFPSIRVFSNEPALHISWPKYWSLLKLSTCYVKSTVAYPNINQTCILIVKVEEKSI